ncbi:HesB/YadR/YfhF family protein [Saliterribacillus persicus]|uniref:Uncharacterized protein YneR n=1 Tax=Saliterribacillus persicus TaxID=930114 RepID=A0A368Y423_9BACI|nr:hypothetical protein [Saliterribacillus persicus]RCW74942.1 uncharacterized protein YneR [Saliterribacillus persicus]
MNLSVTKEAAKWYKDDLELNDGDYLQFFVKLYGGIPTMHPNYFLGVEKGIDGEIYVKDVVEGITFYFNEQDEWLIEEYDMTVDVESDGQEIKFDFQ